METKKRHVADDSETPITKKRALVDAGGSPTPHINGQAVDEPKDDNLERFRKEAIYRSMQHYSREYRRTQARVEELERWQRNCEAGIAALQACWTELIDTTKSLMHPEDASLATVQANDIFDLSQHASDDGSPLAEALRGKLSATKEMLTTVVQRGAPTMLKDQVFRTAQASQAECITLRSEMAILRARLERAEAEEQQSRADLVASERRADRARSQTVAQMNGGSASAFEPPPVSEEISVKGEPEARLTAPTMTPSVSEMVNASSSQSASDWQALAEARSQRVAELEGRLKQLHAETRQMTAEVELPSDAKVIASAAYKHLQERSARLEHDVAESQGKMETLEAEIRTLRESRAQFEESVVAESSKAAQEFKTAIEKRDKDLIRLREQRDQQMAELNERRQREMAHHASFDELRTLADSRSERIGVLHSEVKRLKAQLAADAGHEALLTFFLKDSDGDITFLDDIQRRLRETEVRATSLEQVLSTLDSTSPDIATHCRGEAEARQQLAEASRELDRCRSILGALTTSALPPDAALLTKELESKDEDLRKLRLQVEQHVQAEAASYAELDRLSAAWEVLDKQVKGKVFDLKSMEDKVSKAGHDRAKLENKFFAAMRDKEAVESERKNLGRNVEKQAKAIEKLTTSEKALSAQIGEHDKQVAAFEQARGAVQGRMAALQEETSKWRSRAEEMKNRYALLSKAPCQGCEDISAQNTKAQQMQEEAIRMREKAEKLLMKAKAAPTVPKSTKEAQLQSEVDKCMSILKCSTCKLRMRSTVITKCMHSFCKECVDARISTRQRKCPACNLAFGQADVQTLFFQ